MEYSRLDARFRCGAPTPCVMSSFYGQSQTTQRPHEIKRTDGGSAPDSPTPAASECVNRGSKSKYDNSRRLAQYEDHELRSDSELQERSRSAPLGLLRLGR